MRLRSTLAALLVGTALAAAPSAFAQEGRPEKPESVETYAVSPKNAERLNKITEMINKDQMTAALGELESFGRQEGLNPYERGLVHQFKGVIFADQSKYTQAIREFEAALGTGGFTPAQQLPMIFNLGQLHLAAEQYPQAVRRLEEWFQKAQAAGTTPTGDNYAMLGIAYYQTKQFDKALNAITKALNMTEKPKEAWFQMALAIHFERNNYRAAEALLERALTIYPGNKTFWLQLSGVYGELNKDKEALGALEAAYVMGYLDKSNDIERLARLYLYNEVPYKAAKILERELARGKVERNAKNLELAANAYFNAREYDKAIPLLSQAATASNDGKLFFRLAQSLFAEDKWSEAINAANRALQRGGVDNPGQANVIIGICYTNLKRWDDAREAFVRATKFPKTANEAQRWIEYVDTQIMQIEMEKAEEEALKAEEEARKREAAARNEG